MVESIRLLQTQIAQSQTVKEPQLIEARDIKAMLYLGLRGEIALPLENHEVDILA